MAMDLGRFNMAVLTLCMLALVVICNANPVATSMCDEGCDSHEDTHDEHLLCAGQDAGCDDDVSEETEDCEPCHEEEHMVRSHSHHSRHGRDISEHHEQELQPAPNQELSDDLEVAETHLFRPVFRYKAQYAERRRVRNAPTGDDEFSPPQSQQ